MPAEMYVSRIAPHRWEEPPISGTAGSGTVFFTGCGLRCVFCQNRVISRGQQGIPVSGEELARRMLDMQESGVHNINLVTPTHYTDALVRVLERVRPRLRIPVVWNSGGYEEVSSLRRLEGLVDVYLPDFKYASPVLAAALSGAADYPEVAEKALAEMYRQTGRVRFADSQAGTPLLLRGVLVRHLVLPGCRRDSIAVLDRLAQLLPLPDIRVSVMSQYTPDFLDPAFALTDTVRAQLERIGIRPALRRRLTEFEYRSVLDEADRLGVVGYCQGRASAQATFTPDFGEKTI